MVNPLRLPLVLIGILLGLCYFVHTQSVSKSPILEEAKAVDDSIRLRKAGDVYLTTNVRDLEKSDVDDKPTLAILPEVQDGAPVRAASEPFPTGKRQLSPLPPPGQLPSVLASKGPATDQAESGAQVDNSGSDALPRFLPTRSARQAPLMHRIVDGDDLRDLAARYLGNENRYLEIFEANREILVRPDLLPLGVKIRIPTSP